MEQQQFKYKVMQAPQIPRMATSRPIVLQQTQSLTQTAFQQAIAKTHTVQTAIAATNQAMRANIQQQVLRLPSIQVHQVQRSAQHIQTISTQLHQQYSACQTIGQRINFVCQVHKTNQELFKIKAPSIVIQTCNTQLHTCIQDVRQEFAKLLTKRPEWLEDTLGGYLSGITPVEHAWQNTLQYKGQIDALLTRFDPVLQKNPTFFNGADFAMLYQSRAAFQDLGLQADHLANATQDVLIKQQHAQFKDAINQSIDLIDHCIMLSTISCGTQNHPAAQCINTYTCPQFFSYEAWKKYYKAQGIPYVHREKLWQSYVQGPRAFVVEHMKNGLTAADLVKVCPQDLLRGATHGFLARNLAIVTQLRSHLYESKDINLHPAYAQEFQRVKAEIDAIGGCLMHMLTLVRADKGRNPIQIATHELYDYSGILVPDTFDEHLKALYQQPLKDSDVQALVEASKNVPSIIDQAQSQAAMSLPSSLTSAMQTVELINKELHSFSTQLDQEYAAATNLEQKIDCACHLLVIQHELHGTLVPEEMITACNEKLHTYINDIRKEFNSMLSHDCMTDWLSGIEHVKESWQQVQQVKTNIDSFLQSLDPAIKKDRTGFTAAEVTMLHEASIAFKELSSHAKNGVDLGLDFVAPQQPIEKTKQEHHQFQNKIKSSVALIQGCIKLTRAFGPQYPAATIIKTCNCPKFFSQSSWQKIFQKPGSHYLSSADAWQRYIQGPRTFVITHFKPDITAAEIHKVCPIDSHFSDVHGFLVRNLVTVIQLMQRLPDSIDIEQADYCMRTKAELKDIAGCLMNMLTIERAGRQVAPITANELNDFAIDIARQETDKDRADFYRQSIPDQIIGTITQVAQQYIHCAVQQLGAIGFSTDGQGALSGDLGLCHVPLFVPAQDDGSKLSATIAQVHEHCSQLAQQRAPAPQVKNAPAPPASAQQAASESSTSSTTTVQQETTQAETRRQAILSNAARLLAHGKLNPQQQPDALTQAYQPLEPLIIMVDSGKPFEKQELLLDLVQTMADTSASSSAAAKTGNSECASDWKGVTESLGIVYSILLTKPIEHVAHDMSTCARFAVGFAKGTGNSVTDIAHAACHPQETIQNLEHALNKLDYHLGRLARVNPEEWAKVQQTLQTFFSMPEGNRAEILGELAGNIWGSPALLNKGISLGTKLVSEAELLEKTGGILKKIGDCIAKTTADEKVGITPGGLQVPVAKGMLHEAEDAVQKAAAGQPHIPSTVGHAPSVAPAEQGAPSATGHGEAAPPTTQVGKSSAIEQKIPADQIVKRETYPIQVKRVDYASLEGHLAAKVAKMEKPIFEKANLKHIFGIDKKLKFRASGTIDGSYSGYHHDKGFSLVKKGKVKFLSEPKVCPKTGAVKVDKVMIEGITKEFPQTFFPPEWTHQHTLDKIIEASKAIKKVINDGHTCIELIGVTKEGMEVFMVIRKADRYLVTAYPLLERVV